MPADAPPRDHDLEFLIEVGDNMQASILRAYLEQHGVHCYVQGENHRSMLGMIGAYVQLRLLVPSGQLELARELLERYEDSEVSEPPEFRGAFRDAGEDGGDDDDALSAPAVAMEIRRVRLAALVLPFGGGHFRAGAPVRGLVLAAVAGLGLWYAIAGVPAAIAAWPLAVIADLISAPAVVKDRATSAGQPGAG